MQIWYFGLYSFFRLNRYSIHIPCPIGIFFSAHIKGHSIFCSSCYRFIYDGLVNICLLNDFFFDKLL